MTRIAALAAAALALLAAFTVARPHYAFGPSLRDFEAYYSAGATWKRGDKPYSTAIWKTEKTLPGVNAARFEMLPFVGPPATLPLWAAFARLPYATAAALWRGALILSMLALLCIAWRAAALPFTAFTAISLAIALLGFGAVTNAFSLGQIALPVAAAIGAAFVATRFGGKALATTVAFAQPNLALSLAGEFRRRNAALAVTCGIALFAALCASVSPNAIFTYAQVLIAHGAAEQFSAIQVTPAAIAYGFGASDATAVTIGAACAILAALVWAGAMIRFDDRLMLFTVTSALIPFGAAFFHQHDLVIEFGPAIVLVLLAPPKLLPGAMTAALLVATNWLALAQYPQSWPQACLLAGAFALALLAIRGDITLRALSVPCTIVVLIALAGVASRSHALPVWPDAMASLPTNLTQSDASTIWHAEQVATGLFARDTMWALLRCASLAGCGLLVLAAFRAAAQLKADHARLTRSIDTFEPQFPQ